MYRILLPVDRDGQRAEQMAEVVADLPMDPGDVEVVVLNVFEEIESGVEGGLINSEYYYDENNLPSSVDVALDVLDGAGIDATKRREHGDPAKEIVDVATEMDADLIAMSGRKRSPAGKALFGSVTQSVLLSADRPVLATLGD